jgi:hypothetical protein
MATSGESTNKIWLYWENKDRSVKAEDFQYPYLNLCKKAILKNCPTCDIVYLNRDNLYDYLPTLCAEFSTPARLADYIRWYILYMYGGIWLDVDFIILKDLSDVFKAIDKYGFVCSGTDIDVNPSIGFLGAKKGNELVMHHIFEMEQVLNSKNERDLRWSAIGSDLFYNYLSEFSYHMYESKYFYQIHYEQVDRFFEIEDNYKYMITDEAIGVALYNNVFPDWFKNKSEDAILSSDSLIGWLFRRSLSL